MKKPNMLKTSLFCAALAVFGLSNANAQDFNFGVKAGLNSASYTSLNAPEGAPSIDKGSRVGFHIGGVAEMMLSKKFAIQAELQYSQKGVKYDRRLDTGKQTYTEKLDYITLPIMAKYYITEGLNVELGPELGYLVSAKEKAFQGGEAKMKDAIESFDFGLAGGAGYEFNSGLFLSLRYILGVTSVFKNTVDTDPTNSTVQLSVGYMFK